MATAKVLRRAAKLSVGSLIVFWSTATGQEIEGVKTNFFKCDDDVGVSSATRYFPRIRQESIRVDRELCVMLNTMPGISGELLEDYGEFITRRIGETDFGNDILKENVADQFRLMSLALGGATRGRLRTPSFIVTEDDFDIEVTDAADPCEIFGDYEACAIDCGSDSSRLENEDEAECEARRSQLLDPLVTKLDEDIGFSFYTSVPDGQIGSTTERERVDCAFAFRSSSCATAFNDLMESVNLYKYSYTTKNAGEAAVDLAEKSARWNRFFEEARTPTFIDVWLTSIINNKKFRKGFPQGPPEVQYFALRPNAVLMYNDGAPQGDQFVLGLSLEWIGINWWDQSPIGIPFGVSITSVYGDVPEVDRTIGTGVTFVFDNNLSVGWARHGDDNSYQVSADLLQLFKKTQKRFDQYKSRFDRVVRNESGQGTGIESQ